MSGERRPVFLYVDDGFPESRDYDDNYLEIDPPQPQGRARAQLRLPPLRADRRREPFARFGDASAPQHA